MYANLLPKYVQHLPKYNPTLIQLILKNAFPAAYGLPQSTFVICSMFVKSTQIKRYFCKKSFHGFLVEFHLNFKSTQEASKSRNCQVIQIYFNSKFATSFFYNLMNHLPAFLANTNMFSLLRMELLT
jgi:hypothetical protein